MTICNGGIRLVELEILMVMLGQKDNGKSKMSHYILKEQLQALKQDLPAIAEIIDRLDPETRHHCERLAISAQSFGEYLKLSATDLQMLVWGAYLHDIGKAAIPADILLKPAALTAAERQVIQEHPALGIAICPLPESMKAVAEIIRHHHELWNGQGYPDRLAGEAIPYLVRIVQILDVYDALTHERCYKRAYSSSEAISILLTETAKGFYQSELISEFIAYLESEDGFSDLSNEAEFMIYAKMSNITTHDTATHKSANPVKHQVLELAS
jgi:putative two-component system response regulator